jgi:hypothetical protein
MAGDDHRPRTKDCPATPNLYWTAATRIAKAKGLTNSIHAAMIETNEHARDFQGAVKNYRRKWLEIIEA